MKAINIPTILTLLRLLVSPLILPILFVVFLPYNVLWLNVALGILFIALSITDFFDGYLARKYNQETVLGQLLDPLADKFLTCSALISLLAVNKIFFYWVLIFIGRELFVMGIRHVALTYNFAIPVSSLSKAKTAAQMILITIITINPYHYLGMRAPIWNGSEGVLIFVTLMISLITAYYYYESFIGQLKEKMVSPVTSDKK